MDCGRNYVAMLRKNKKSVEQRNCNEIPTLRIGDLGGSVDGDGVQRGMSGGNPQGMGNMPMGNSNQPFDLLFIDSMMMHHQGAIEMAKQAQTEATKPEIKQLAGDIITSQAAEVKQMQAWRKAWYPDAAPTQGMGMDMGTMAVAAGDKLYDLRFIEAMIPHHEGAMAMAKEAQQKAEHPEIKTLAGNIIKA